MLDTLLLPAARAMASMHGLAGSSGGCCGVATFSLSSGPASPLDFPAFSYGWAYFSAIRITAYLENPEAKLEHAQQMAAHSDPKRPGFMTGVTMKSRWMRSRGLGFRRISSASRNG
jgi:hypothetical protein